MKKIFSFLTIVVAAAALLAGISSCDKDFDPIERDDFIGTRWLANDDAGSYSLAFKKTMMEFRGEKKSGGYFILTGDYDYWPQTKTIVMTFDKKEEHGASADWPGAAEYVLGNGILSEGKTSFEYSDTRGLQVTFSKSN